MVTMTTQFQEYSVSNDEGVAQTLMVTEATWRPRSFLHPSVEVNSSNMGIPSACTHTCTLLLKYVLKSLRCVQILQEEDIKDNG